VNTIDGDDDEIANDINRLTADLSDISHVIGSDDGPESTDNRQKIMDNDGQQYFDYTTNYTTDLSRGRTKNQPQKARMKSQSGKNARKRRKQAKNSIKLKKLRKAYTKTKITNSNRKSKVSDTDRQSQANDIADSILERFSAF